MASIPAGTFRRLEAQVQVIHRWPCNRETCYLRDRLRALQASDYKGAAGAYYPHVYHVSVYNMVSTYGKRFVPSLALNLSCRRLNLSYD